MGLGTMPPIDPTKNVIDLVRAESGFRDKLRKADQHYEQSMRDAETRRINDLAALRAEHSIHVEGMRDAKIDNSAKLLADQLREIKSDLQVEIRGLNQFRWESGGKSAGSGMVTYIIVQAVLTIAGLAGVIGTLLAILRH